MKYRRREKALAVLMNPLMSIDVCILHYPLYLPYSPCSICFLHFSPINPEMHCLFLLSKTVVLIRYIVMLLFVLI
jgi:hypothetical protein